MKKPTPKIAPLKEDQPQPELFPELVPLTVVSTPEKPRCGNCQHFGGKICDIVLPPFVRVTDRPYDRIVSKDFVCSFHSR